jgi:very-short-patch-repair endonuclease
VCIEAMLVVELDGGQHGDVAVLAYDQKREQVMATLGFRTLRFWDNEVLKETEGVLERIRQTAEALTPTLSRERERSEDTLKGMFL